MKKIFNYIVLLCTIIICCAGIVFVRVIIADTYSACLSRACHAALIRDKIKLCMQKKYKKLLPDIVPQEINFPQSDTDHLLWLPVKSETYGPQKKIRQNVKIVRNRVHKKTGHHGEQQQDLLTHRAAPFSLPLVPGSFWISSRFGPRRRPDGSPDFHYGLDLAANKGTPVYAARTGLVIYAGWNNGYGNTIVIKHGNHFKTRYAHLDRIIIKTGDTVARGIRIGCVGATGHIRKKGGDGSHLHFEVHYRGKKVDPLQFLPDIV